MRNKVLVVDDEPEILDAISIILEKEDFSVRALGDAADFDRVLKEFEPDLILLDVLLGDLDGRDICSLVKQDKSTSHIPVILISASSDLSASLQRNCRPDDFIEKPFDSRILVQKVRNWLDVGR